MASTTLVLILISAKCPQKFMWMCDLIWTAMQLHKYQSVTRKEAEECSWSWKGWRDYFPVFSTCETIARLLRPVLEFPNTRKTWQSAGSQAEGESRELQRISKGSFQPKLLYNSANKQLWRKWKRGNRVFEPGLLLKLLCCENTAPGSPEQGSVSLHMR